MAVFGRQQNSAEKLIKKYGANAILRKYTPASVDPLKPWVQVPASQEDTSIIVALFPFTSNSDSYKTQSWASKFGGDIPTGVEQAYVAAKNVTIDNSDTIHINGKAYTILNVNLLAPNAVEKILYDVVLKA